MAEDEIVPCINQLFIPPDLKEFVDTLKKQLAELRMERDALKEELRVERQERRQAQMELNEERRNSKKERKTAERQLQKAAKELKQARQKAETELNRERPNVPRAASGPERAKPKQVLSLRPRAAKLERGENAYVPTTAKDKKQKQPKSEEEKVQALLNKAQRVLNKMTWEKFDRLSDELISIGTDMPDEAFAQFVDRVFQKAIDEPFFSKMYAQLCTKCSMATLKGKKEPILPKFRPLLLKACQQKFQQDNQDAVKTKEFEERQAREASEVAKGDVATNKDHLSEQEIEDEKLRVATALRHTLGNIKFIGELFLCNMVSANVVVNSCIEPLLKSKADDEDSLECLCKLMETTGAKLEDVARTPALKNALTGYMSQMEDLAKRKGIPARVKLMILNVLEMRKRGWEART
eukprot:TRINITY_DN12005_c0_g2_i4.p1 TRINITY_DN12005_c0_g2~~TRINITY_DN12005_c0_g2_i4.p1  ORF type:complete len:409 (+),score=116.84 TRINITY_DN12005_c0_g2_i4:271-1497(+)